MASEAKATITGDHVGVPGFLSMRKLVRKSWLYFAAVTLCACALRLIFVLKGMFIDGDAAVYGELAKNWLAHGILGMQQDATHLVPSVIRLPGYPAFLASIWAITGPEHYRAVLLVQGLVDVLCCFVVADLALRTTRSPRIARLAFLLAALCPFTATYTGCAITETLAIFFTALALDLAVIALDSGQMLDWAACGAAIAGGILLRPDGGIVLAVALAYPILPMLAWARTEGHGQTAQGARRWLLGCVVVSAVALAPLLPWTVRNWRTFHVFQPLVPRYATAPGQYVPLGYERWVKTWMADYISVVDIYWVEGDQPLSVEALPSRAFDTPEERARTESLFAAYNSGPKVITRDLDRQFAQLAGERIHRHPLRYYLTLPARRIVDMWLRPRVEMLDVAEHWWEFHRHRKDFAKAVALGVLNLAYLGAAVWAAVLWMRRPQAARYWGMLLGFVVLRSLFLGTLENPEPRYTLECYPVVIVLAAAALAVPRSSYARRKRSTLTAFVSGARTG
jgi:hypothetical protein